MFLKMLRGFSGTATLLLLMVFPIPSVEASPKTFAYVSKNYIITAEAGSERSFVVNLINLSDFVIVIQPNEFIYKGASGRFYIGQVFEQAKKDMRGDISKYSASFLLKGHSFAGFTIAGAFREQDQIDELSVRIQSQRFYLQPIEKTAFEQLAARISKLEIANTNPDTVLEAASISEAGTVKSTDGTSEWDRDWQGLITPDGINPIKIIERTNIEPTAEAIKARTYGKVKLSGIINKNGGIQDLKIVKGPGRSLDQQALDGVKNGWLFLPATKSGEVIEAAISIEVDFSDPEKKQ
jgi:TonB family protein